MAEKFDPTKVKPLEEQEWFQLYSKQMQAKHPGGWQAQPDPGEGKVFLLGSATKMDMQKASGITHAVNVPAAQVVHYSKKSHHIGSCPFSQNFSDSDPGSCSGLLGYGLNLI